MTLRAFSRLASSGAFSRFNSRSGEEKLFQDYVKVYVHGGHGGKGASLFLSVYGNEFAGTSGGDGGNGGHIILEASESVKSLEAFGKVLTG